MSLELANRLDVLRDRANCLAKARTFFAKRGVLEVDVPILSQAGSVDVHIDLIEAQCCRKTYYLHSSPEYGMKKLLAEGIGDIFQISHVFRDFERGENHSPEFMMVEWYRIGFTFEQMIQETLEFATLFLGEETFDVVSVFPEEEAALAQIGPDGMAERFEIFCRGIELANGYHELIDPKEQKSRLEEGNKKREALGKCRYPIDHDFLAALEKGIPDCCGVAVGFDRLMMLRNDLKKLDDACCFSV